jgi:hypothetical protein
MKLSFASVAAAALLSVALIVPQSAAAADDLKVKPGTSAKDVGRCATATVLVAKLTEEEAKKTNDTTFADLGLMWLNHIQAQPDAYQTEAMAAMADTATGYQTAMKDDSDGVLATIIGDVAKCLEYLDE